MQKYYKKFSNNVSIMDPTFLGQKKDLLLNELGATLCKINRKCGEICLFETPASSGSKKIKIKKKHHHEFRPHTTGELKEKIKVKSSKDSKSIELASSSKQAAKTEGRESSKHESSHKRRAKHYRLLGEDPGNVKHLYEDSQTEIYFINTSNKNRKRKHVGAKHRVENHLLGDNSFANYSFARDRTRRVKDSGDFYKRDSESQPTTKEPFAVSTLSQLSSIFFKSSKHEKPKEERHKKHSRHTVETSDLLSDPKSRPFGKIHHVHHAQVVHHNQMTMCSENREKKSSVIKHVDALEDIQEEKNEYKDDSKIKHGKGERISIRVSDKSKRRSKKRDGSGIEPKSLFQNLHVNFGKCIMLEERKHNCKSSEQRDTSVLGGEDVSSQHDVKEWIRKQQIRKWSKNSLRMIESKRSKSESSLNRKTASQASALQAKMYKRRNTVSEKTEILFAKSSQRMLRSKSSLPFTVPSEEVATKLSRDDFVYFIEKLRQSFEDGSVRDMQRSMSLVRKKSAKDTGKFTRKQKLKRLSRTSYLCIFEMSPDHKNTILRSSKSSSRPKRKSKREMVLCKDVVSIENIVPQQLNINECTARNERLKDSTACEKGSKDSKASTKKIHHDEIKVKSSQKEVCTPKNLKIEQEKVKALELNGCDNSARHINTAGCSVDPGAHTEIDNSIKERRRSQLVQTVFNIVSIPPIMQGASGILKQFTKKVSFPESQVEEMVEKKKRTASFRRYYKYSSDTIECTDNGSQTWTNAFLSDCNIACGFSDVMLDDYQEDQMLHSSTEVRNHGRYHSESRIPIKVGKTRPSKQNTIRRRDICSCSDTSSHISTSDTEIVHNKKKKTPKTKQEQPPAPTYLISNVSCPLEATLKNILEEVASRLEEKPTNNVGVSCSISANSSPRYYSPQRRIYTPGRLRSQPSSIRTDSEPVSVASARSRSSWNVIKKPTVINTRSNSAMENRLVSKSTLRYSENSLRTQETRNTSNQPFAIDEGGKVDGRALIDELVQRLADIKQDLLLPHACSFDDAATTETPVINSKKIGNVSRSLSPPKSKLPFHRNTGARDVERAKSFIEENKHIRARIKNYKMKNNLEPKKTYQVISNRKTGVSKAKISTRTASDTSVTKERLKPVEINSLSVIASKSETNMAVYRETIRPQYSRVSSRITLENFLNPKRQAAIEKAVDSRSCSINRRDRSTNSNMSTLFLTKDYRSTSTMSSYQRRKNYDLYMRRLLKLKSENEGQKYPMSPQVFEVRYVTVTNDADPKIRVPMVTRSTQNTAEQGCQVSCASDTSGESYGQIIRCISLDDLSLAEAKPCRVCANDQSTVDCQKCPPCVKQKGTKKRDKSGKKNKKNKYSRISQTSDSCRKEARQSQVPSIIHSIQTSTISPKETTVFILQSEENVLHVAPKDSVPRTLLKVTPSCNYKKDTVKTLQFELPHSHQINHMSTVSSRKRISCEQEAKNENWGFSEVAGYLTSALFCCCIGEPPRKKRKCSKSKRHQAKKCVYNVQATDNFQVQLGRAFDSEFSKPGFNFKLAFGGLGDKKRQNEGKPLRHPDVTEKSLARKFFPVEWFRNISSLVFLEQNVINAPPIFPEIPFDLVNTKFDSAEQETFCLIDEKYCSGDEIGCVEDEKNLDEECSSLLTDNNSDARQSICELHIQFNQEDIAAFSKNTRVLPLIRRSKSDITLNTRRMDPGEMNMTLLQAAATAISLSTNYSTCLASSRRTSIRGSLSEVNNITARTNEDLEGDCTEDVVLTKAINTEQPSCTEGDLFEINKSDGLSQTSIRKCPQIFDPKSTEHLLSSQESGYTSLTSSKTPSPTSFFKRRSIMELFKFPLERAKSRSSIVDISSYAMFNSYDARELRSDTSLQAKKITDRFSRTCSYNQMSRDCQRYAQKVRMCAEQKHDGVFDGDDDYTEISLDILLGRNTGISEKKPSRTQFETRPSNTTSLIILEDSESEISVVESVTEVYRSSSPSNHSTLLPDITSGDFSLCFTKISKSEGALKDKFIIYDRNKLQVTKSDSYMDNDFNVLPLDYNVKRSFERFSTSLSNRMADRDFFQKLIVLYERENEYVETLYNNPLFFDEQIELVEGKKATNREKKKSKHLFKSWFKRNKKSSKCGNENLMFYARDNILYAESSNRLSQLSLDGYVTDCSKEDCMSLTEGKAYSSEELEAIPIETFQQLAHKVMRHFGPLVKASSSNKFMNDELKLTGFQKLLENIEQGDIAMLQRNVSFNWEECVREQIRQFFTSMYEAAKEAANLKKARLSDVQLDLLKKCATKYRNNIQAHLDLVAVCIGKDVIKTQDQLKAAVVYLSRLDGNRYVNCEEIDAYITRER